MSEALIREIAERVVQQQFLLQWPTYALMIAIALVSGFSGAYFGAYAKKRGEFHATRADFDALLAQVRATTTVAEEVKASVSHSDWAAREQRTLRRQKLEELIHSIYEVQAWQEQERDARIYESAKPSGLYPMPKTEVLAGLYFPELREEIQKFGTLHRALAMAILQSHSELLSAKGNPSEKQAARNRFADVWRPLYQDQLSCISEIETHAREIMAKLVGA